MMLVSRAEELWLPGKIPGSSGSMTEAEQQPLISRSRKELMRILDDLPEPEHHELSFTDLVEHVPAVATGGTPSKKIGSHEEEEEVAKEAAKKMVKSMRWDGKKVKRSGSGVTSGSGVLLNLYVPPPFRGLTLNLNPSPRLRWSSSSLESESTPAPTPTPTSSKVINRREKASPPVGTEEGNSSSSVRMECTACLPSIWAKGKTKPRKHR